MEETEKTWPCPRCGGDGYENWEEDGRPVTDPCYHCGTTGRVGYNPQDRSTWPAHMIEEEEREAANRYPCSHGDPCLCWDVEPEPTLEEVAQWDKEYLGSLTDAEREAELAQHEETKRRTEREASVRLDNILLSDEMGNRPGDFYQPSDNDFDDPFAE